MNLSDLTNYTIVAGQANTHSPKTGDVDGATDDTGQALQPAPSSSQETGRVPGSGLDIISKSISSLGSSSTAATLPLSSVFPYQGIDTFVEKTNDSGMIVQPSDFNALIAAARATEEFLLHAVRYAPIDLLERLNTEGHRYLNGVDDTVGVSTLRRPRTLTLGTSITITGTSTSFASGGVLSIPSGMATAFGISTSGTGFEDLKGVAFQCGAKIQTISVDPLTIDPAALSGRVEAVVTDHNTIRLHLCTGPYIQDATNYPELYNLNSGVPYLAPGKWYLYIKFYLSPYAWNNI